VDFQVGEKVVHWNYGMGEILQLDEKLLAGQMTRCYVVRIRDLTIWVPILQKGDSVYDCRPPGMSLKTCLLSYAVLVRSYRMTAWNEGRS